MQQYTAYPTSVTNNGAGQSWSNAGNVTAEDGNAAYVNLHGGNQQTTLLQATGFDFSAVPDGATITGIVVEWKKKRTVSVQADDAASRLVKAGAVGSTDRSVSGHWPYAALTFVSYGSDTELWGDTWTTDDIKDSGFGAALAAKEVAGDSVGTVQVDVCRITIYTS